MIFNRAFEIALLATAVALTSCSGQQKQPELSKSSERLTPALAAALLTEKFETASEVQFYFLTRTGDYSLNPADFKKASVIRIYRACGNSCASFMGPIINHLHNAQEFKCQVGQEDAIVEFAPGDMIIYSYSGRVIKFNGSCFLNRQSVHGILRSSPFYFERS